MTQANVTKKLMEVKLALALKYDRLGKVAGSVPKRKAMVKQAAKFRRQAADLSRQ